MAQDREPLVDEGGTMYPILRAGEMRGEWAGVCALAVMAKAPRAGKVKTRLAPALGMDGSAAINICFLARHDAEHRGRGGAGECRGAGLLYAGGR
jgi:hypothetical protein